MGGKQESTRADHRFARHGRQGQSHSASVSLPTGHDLLWLGQHRRRGELFLRRSEVDSFDMRQLAEVLLIDSSAYTDHVPFRKTARSVTAQAKFGRCPSYQPERLPANAIKLVVTTG